MYLTFNLLSLSIQVQFPDYMDLNNDKLDSVVYSQIHQYHLLKEIHQFLAYLIHQYHLSMKNYFQNTLLTYIFNFTVTVLIITCISLKLCECNTNPTQ